MLAHVTAQQRPPGPAAFLDGIPFFAALDEPTRLQLAKQLEPVHAAAGEVIISQGEPGDGLFVVVSGRLRVSVAAAGAERVLHDLGRGSVVGEIALISNRPRSATVRAVRDSDLLLLSTSAFNSLVERSPAVLREIAQVLADRLLSVDRPQPRPPDARAIAVIQAGTNPGPAATVTERLTAQLARAGPVFRVDAEVVDRHLGPGAAQRAPGDRGRAELAEWLDAVERGNDYVIYQPDVGDTAWSRVCISQSDVALLVAAALDDPSPGPAEARALAAGSLRCELVLVHARQPLDTDKWLADRPVSDHHHLRDGHPEDTARLARMITGNGCGLVLGGGGPRGFAHLGVLRAVEEAGLPVDVVGGTSIGAVIGAFCALGMDHAERVDQAVTAFIRSGWLVSPTLPLVSLSSGRRVDRLLAQHLGLGLIEDLSRRFFCVSANLTTAEEVIHDRGALWSAVRASLSLPGLLPPVFADGDLLIDGGALDNVPVEVMRARVGNGCVIAVDLSPKVEPLTAVPFGPGLSGWRVLGHRLNPVATRRRIPSIVDIMSRSNGLSQVRLRRAALAGADTDLFLRPPVPALGALDFKSAVPLLETGYRHASEELAKSGLANRFAL
jgi:NTE family protein